MLQDWGYVVPETIINWTFEQFHQQSLEKLVEAHTITASKLKIQDQEDEKDKGLIVFISQKSKIDVETLNKYLKMMDDFAFLQWLYLITHSI